MVDKVRALKIEKSGEGTEIDPFPTETDPSEDYLASKGIALENSDATIIYGDSGVMKFKDTQKTTAHSLDNLLDAEYEDFDPTGTDLTSTKTGPAIRELEGLLATAGGFSRSTVTSNLVIPINQQMIVYQSITIDDGITLTIDGEVVVID